MKKPTENEEFLRVDNDYRFGFQDPEQYVFKARKGLDEEVRKKNVN